MTSITFTINGKKYEADGNFGPDVSLNEYIRNVADLRGTKAMCHEGGCGACVVTVRAPLPPNNQVKTFAVNSCLVSVLSCHGWEVITVEGLGNRTIGYHDIQTRLAKFNGTQCGYCTPGWIMNMYSLQESKKPLTTKDIENSFAGNICRCTGYRPIADAFKTFATDTDESLISKLCDLEDLNLNICGVNCNKKCRHKRNDDVKVDDYTFVNDNKMIKIESGDRKWFRVYSLDDVFKTMANGDYKLIAGNTGQGVYHVTNYPKNTIDIFNIAELKNFIIDVNLIIGAGVPLTDMMQIFQLIAKEKEEFSYLNQFYDHMDLVAHIPVRNIGTIGGNLFLKYLNNDFQSDLFVLFETVGAMLTIAESVSKSKVVTLPEFLKTNMDKKIILNVLLPPLSKFCRVKTYKIMPRSQNAHAVVNSGFLFKFKPNTEIIEQATLVYGSIGPTFIHAKKTEKLLVGKDLFSNETVQAAVKMLFEEINPVDSPPEPSAGYRKMLAVCLFYKAILSLCPDNKINPRYKSGGEAIKRQTSKGSQSFETDQSVWPLNQPIPKLEALVQCSGEATFANDTPSETNEVFAAFVIADTTPGSIISEFDTSEAMKLSGVVAFYTAKDIPGQNTFTPSNVPFISDTEEILCSKEVKFNGQPVAIIVANREKTANKAAKLVKVKYAPSTNKPLLSIEDVMDSPFKKARVKHDMTIEPTDTGNDIQSVIYGEMRVNSQYHYYMEPQTCVVKPTEDGMEVYSSTQWLDLTNIAISTCLKVPVNSINVIVRRVGGGYGGKISRSSQIACAAALVSHLQGKTCRMILPLQTNMRSIGKRISTSCNYEVGIDKEGVIQYLKNDIYQNAGHSYNETITPLIIKPFNNCYDAKRWKIETNSVRTDTPSNTWCRAPFSTEGVAMIEHIMEKIAYTVDKDPIEVRLKNMTKENNPIPEMIEQLKKDADFATRKIKVAQFNDLNRWRKRAIKLIPLTVDIFYTGNYNSLISIYHGDGTVVITHGGIEMGQGLNTKAAQVCAYTLGIPLEKVSVKPSTSFTSPNAIVTGGSIGSECVAFATMKACEILNERLEPFKKKMDKVVWEDVVEAAYKAGVDLQASYMFSPQKDNVQTYDVYAVGIIEIEIDLLTGNHEVKRVDILEDTGRSLSPEIDIAQIEGAFIMGLGYWTSEILIYDKITGKLLTDRTWTYKPPGIKDIPADMRIYFRRNARNPNGILQSKATGEPALCLATVFIHAVQEIVRTARLEAGYQDQWINIENPCSVENIFLAFGHKLEHFTLK